jgi:membrane associated rhomboid family serine protease
MDKKIILLMASLAIVYIIIFIIPGSADKLALMPEKIQLRQYWRFVTYPFAHLNARHLIENIVGAALVGIIATELKTDFAVFALVYILSGFLAALPLWFALQFIALGASTAIFGGFGMVSLETKKYNMKSMLIILLFVPFIFARTMMSISSPESLAPALKQDLAHLSGFIFGIGMFFFASWIGYAATRNKRQILRRASQ